MRQVTRSSSLTSFTYLVTLNFRMATTEISANDEHHDTKIGSTEEAPEKTRIAEIGVLDVEEGDAEKTYFSRASAILMIVFSGLAIGSDS